MPHHNIAWQQRSPSSRHQRPRFLSPSHHGEHALFVCLRGATQTQQGLRRHTVHLRGTNQCGRATASMGVSTTGRQWCSESSSRHCVPLGHRGSPRLAFWNGIPASTRASDCGASHHWQHYPSCIHGQPPLVAAVPQRNSTRAPAWIGVPGRDAPCTAPCPTRLHLRSRHHYTLHC